MFEQRSKAWDEVRLGKFTASNFHYLKGNGFLTKGQIIDRVAFERLTGKRQQPNICTPDMLRGIVLEAEARRIYEQITGYKVMQVGFIERDEWSGCSPDGLPGVKKLLEIKCPNYENYLKYKKRLTIRPDHMSQMQFSLLCSERETYDYMIYCKGQEPIIQKDVERDEKHIEHDLMILDKSKKAVLSRMDFIRSIKNINRCNPRSKYYFLGRVA
jgi:hypothetical protein